MSSTTSPPANQQTFQGNDKLLAGLVFSVMTFWLFAQSTGTIAPVIMRSLNSGGTEVISATFMNFAVSVTALFSGMFIVLAGGFADRYGRVKLALIGNVLGIVGSLLLVAASGGLAVPLILAGRIIQGLSAACVMPSTLSLVRTYWDGAARQRAISIWSIGTFGGSGLSSITSGYLNQFFGWRSIFILSAAISLIAILLVRGTPESKVPADSVRKADVPGIISFLITILALMVLVTFGKQIGFFSPIGIGLIVVMVIGFAIFYMIEKKAVAPFIDFALFRNRMFTGATLGNFMVNTGIGVIMVSQQLLQMAGKDMTAASAGQLTLGYAAAVILFIRLGEKVMQKRGARDPMLMAIGCLAIGCILLMPTNLLLGQYKILAVIAYIFFGLGLALFATPSTDTALTNLPPEQSGAGAGIFKMASSLGGALGAAISLSIYAAIGQGSGNIALLGNVLEIQGRTDNVALRQGATMALLFHLVLFVMAFLIVLLMVPKWAGTPEAEQKYKEMLAKNQGKLPEPSIESVLGGTEGETRPSDGPGAHRK
ncbi:MAG: MFS transporter [Dermatophilus congolensis]|nr:MFS transporter [Dermatophilus congolensis]